MIPILIAAIQVTSFIYFYYLYRTSHAHIPAAFIEVIILSILNAPVLLLAYFCFLKKKKKNRLWWGPVLLATIPVVISIIAFSVMLWDEYVY